jgi:hypothetical protein
MVLGKQRRTKMKLSSIGGLAIVGNLVFGFANVANANPFLSTFGALAILVGGVIIGMSIMERFTRT